MRIILFILMCLLPMQATAQIRWSTVDEVVQAEVVPGWRGSDGRHIAALRFTLTPGWKTYWRSPGATGIAPQFDWRRSKNLAGVTHHWPVPRVVVTAGEPSLGYDEGFLLPLTLTPRDSDAPIHLQGQLDIGVCETICLPARLTVDAVLHPGGKVDAQIRTQLANQPRPGRGTVTCTIRPSNEGVILNAQVPAPRAGNAPYVAVEMAHAQDRLWITDTDVRRDGRVLSTQTEFMVPQGSAVSINREYLSFTVVTGGRAIEYHGCTR